MVTATHLSENFSRKECECRHCGEIPSVAFVNLLQEIRDIYGKPMRITSMYRCPEHNAEIGGYEHSAHLVKGGAKGHGAADIALPQKNNHDRWRLVKLAMDRGFNNIEICNAHIHLGRVPSNHPGYNKFIWGISK